MPSFDKKLTIVCVFYNMRREAPRTLHTLTSGYQNLSENDYDVIVIDNNSAEPLDETMVSEFGPQFHFISYKESHQSPVFALNYGISLCQSDLIACHIDGARLLSPGILNKMIDQIGVYPNAMVYTIGFHLGPALQNVSILDGYNQEEEDKLLRTIDWRRNGYQLFTISATAGSASGFFNRTLESNCFAVSRTLLEKHGGFEERFVSKGGGLCNLEMFGRYVSDSDVLPIVLVGEGTFHQIHGGISTNVGASKHPLQLFRDEYFDIFGYEYAGPKYEPFLHGRVEVKNEQDEDYMATQAISVLMKLLDSGEHGLIKKYINYLVSRWSDNYSFILRCARICKKQKYYPLARQLFSICLEKKNNHEYTVRADLAALDYLEGDAKTAREKLLEILKLSPRNTETLRTLYRIEKDAHDFEKAIYYNQRIIEYNHPARFLGEHVQAGLMHYRLDKLDDAIIHLYYAGLWSMARVTISMYHLAFILYDQKAYGISEFYTRKLLRENHPKALELSILIIRILVAQERISEVAYFYQTYKSLWIKKRKAVKRLLKSHTDSEVINDLLLDKFAVDKPDSPNRIICILGMHRSGTSCLTGSLQSAGFHSTNALGWNYDNLKGNREEIDVITLNHLVQEHNKQSWRKVNIAEKITWTSQLAAQRNDLVQSRLEDSHLWMFKDPRTVVTLPFWKACGVPFVYTASFRHPMKTALSLYLRNQMPIEKGLQLWHDYNKIILRVHRNNPFPLTCFDSTRPSYRKQLDHVMDYLTDQLLDSPKLDRDAAYAFYEKQLESKIYDVDFDSIANQHDIADVYKDSLAMYNELCSLTPSLELTPNIVDENSVATLNRLFSIQEKLDPDEIFNEYLSAIKEGYDNKLFIHNLLKHVQEHPHLIISEALLKSIGQSTSADTQLLLLNYYNQHDIDIAKQRLKNTEEAFPEYIELTRLGGDIHMAHEDAELAATYYQKVADVRPLDFHSHMQLYRIAEAKGDQDMALKYVSRAYRSNAHFNSSGPDYIQALIKYGRKNEIRQRLSAFEQDKNIRFNDWFDLADYLLEEKEIDLLMPCLFKLATLRGGDENKHIRFNRLRNRSSRMVFPEEFRAGLMM